MPKSTLYLLLVAILSSCVSPRSVTYFQGGKAVDSARVSQLLPVTPPKVTIQTGDILAIFVTSTSAESNTLFNFQNTNPVYTTTLPGSNAQGQQPLGYLVDDAGYVTLPLIGRVLVNGLSIKEASALLTKKAGEFLRDPVVTIRQLNHRITVLGEVNRPGVFNLPNNETTLPELMGMAGDLTIFGRRDNVMLIRMTNDKREVIRLDLTNRSLLNSPYFYVQNNDVLYVEARKGRLTSSDRSVQLLPIYVGVASALLFLVNILVR